jgi:hypothetical protein
MHVGKVHHLRQPMDYDQGIVVETLQARGSESDQKVIARASLAHALAECAFTLPFFQVLVQFPDNLQNLRGGLVEQSLGRIEPVVYPALDHRHVAHLVEKGGIVGHDELVIRALGGQIDVEVVGVLCGRISRSDAGTEGWLAYH